MTTTRLSRELGLTSGALFRHFPNREAMLEAAVALAVERMMASIPEGEAEPLERILQLARNRIALVREDAGLAWLFRSEEAEQCLPDEARASIRHTVRQTRSFVLAALREGMEQGQVRRDIEARLLLVPVLGTIHLLIESASSRASHRPGPEFREEALQSLCRLLQPCVTDNTQSPTIE